MKTCTNCTILKPEQILKCNEDMECIECGKRFYIDTTVDNVRDALNKLKDNIDLQYKPLFYTMRKEEWLDDTTFGWTKEEIEQADYFIGNRHGIDCYITKPLQATSK